MNENDLNVLDEVNKGATMGMDAIEFIEKKVGDEKFRNMTHLYFNDAQGAILPYNLTDLEILAIIYIES